jgi:hypothetical protein
MTPSEFRSIHNLSPDQFKRLKAKVKAANPGLKLTKQVGATWEIISPELFTAHLPPSESPSDSPTSPTDSPTDSPTGGLVLSRPVELVPCEVFTPEVIQLSAYVPNFSAQIDRALLEVQHSNQVSSGNAHLINQAELQAAVAQGVAQAHVIHAATEKAKAAALAQLQQQQLNAMGLGLTAPAATPVQAPAATPVPAKK